MWVSCSLESGLKRGSFRAALRAGGLRAMTILMAQRKKICLIQRTLQSLYRTSTLLRRPSRPLDVPSTLVSVIQSLAPSLYGLEDPLTTAGQGIVPAMYSFHASGHNLLRQIGDSCNIEAVTTSTECTGVAA